METTLRQNSGTRWTVTIPANDSKSNAFPISEECPRGLVALIPDAWTAADLAIEVSDDGTNWFPLENDSGTKAKLTSIPASASPRPFRVFPAVAWGAGAFAQARLVSVNTSNEDAYVVQQTARTIVVVPLS